MKGSTHRSVSWKNRLRETGAYAGKGDKVEAAAWGLLAVGILVSLFIMGSGPWTFGRPDWLFLLALTSGIYLGAFGCRVVVDQPKGKAPEGGEDPAVERSEFTDALTDALMGAGADIAGGHTVGGESVGLESLLGCLRDLVHTLVETAQTAIVILDPSGGVRFVNRAFIDVTGYGSSELQGGDWFELVVPAEDRERLQAAVRQALEGSRTVECTASLIARDGTQPRFGWRWKTLIDSSRTVSGLLGMGIDVTDRYSIHDALRKSEERLRAIVEDQTELISRFKPDGTLTFVNGAYCRYFGEKPEQLLGNKFWHHVPKHEQERLRQHIARLTPEHPVSTIEHPVKTPQGIRWQQWTDRAIFDREGRVVELQAVGRDITERKRVEEALASERSRLYSVLDSLPVFVFLHAADYAIRFANRSFQRNFGDGTGRRCFAVLQGRSGPCPECRSGAVLLDGRAQSWEWTAGKNGRTFQMYSYPFTDMDGTPLVLQLGIDITDQKRNEMELRRSELRLRELSGRLLTAQEEERQRIARELHDSIGSSLTGIAVFLQAILIRIEEGSPLKEPVRQVIALTENTIQDARRIMSDLRPSLLDDLGVLKTLEWFCREFQQLHPAIHTETRFDIGEEDIPDSLKIVVFRLVQEAFHNIAKHSGAEKVTLGLEKTAERIKLTVEDNGRGFPMEDLLHPESPMKGLGLTSMRERTELSGGRFTLRSTVGEGTTVQAEWELPAPAAVLKTSP